ncbi:MAG: DUF3106 domain-containing protein [Verrucomicrobiota bacterium]
MKRLIHICLLTSLCFTTSIWAQPTGDHTPERDRASKQTLLLHSLMKMSPEELAELRETIERIEAMPEEERESIRQRLRQLEKMDPKKVEKIRKRFEAIPEEKRKAMRERWFAMSPKERREWREKLLSMTEEERAQLVEDEEFLPPPLRHGPGVGPHHGVDRDRPQ